MESETARVTRRPVPWHVGRARPVYFWAGEATAHFQRLKFPDIAVDETAHTDGITPEGMARLADAGFNRVFLAANWGFPPEIEERYWAEFAEAARHARAHGLRPIAYVQASNAVALGSYRDRDWYAVTPAGGRIPYYSGRYMTCLNSPDWRAEVAARVETLIEAGADGIYFDNVWMGATPWILGATYGGFAGCFCARCRTACTAATGTAIPRTVRPDDVASRTYLRWRADRVTRRLSDWAARARECRPGIPVAANACAAVMRNAYVLFGIDYAAWSEVLDLVVVEDVALPRHHEGRPGRARLSQAAITAKAARSVASDRPVCTVSYDRGIGLDRLPAPRPYLQALAEAAACDAIGVLKGTEYLDRDGRFTVITAPGFEDLRAASAGFQGWLEARCELFRGRRSAAPVGLLYPYRAALDRWERWAPGFFAAAAALIDQGIPFRVVGDATTPEEVAGLSTLVVPGDRDEADRPPLAAALRRQGARVIEVPPDFWSAPFGPRPPFFLRTGRLRRWVGRLFTGAHRAYFTRPVLRRLFHRTRLINLAMQSPYFRIPRESVRFLELLEPVTGPRVRAPHPVLVEYWRRDGERQLHLVNYGASGVTVRVEGTPAGEPELVTPNTATRVTESGSGALSLTLDLYGILIWRQPADP